MSDFAAGCFFGGLVMFVLLCVALHGGDGDDSNENNEYINDYLDTSKITVGGGWGEETKEYTASEYIKQHIGEMMRENRFTVTETSGYNSGRKVETTFEDIADIRL